MGAGSESYDAEWGCFHPSQRFNVDQSRMPFVVDSRKTYEIIKVGDKHQKNMDKSASIRIGKEAMYTASLHVS